MDNTKIFVNGKLLSDAADFMPGPISYSYGLVTSGTSSTLKRGKFRGVVELSIRTPIGTDRTLWAEFLKGGPKIVKVVYTEPDEAGGNDAKELIETEHVEVLQYTYSDVIAVAFHLDSGGYWQFDLLTNKMPKVEWVK